MNTTHIQTHESLYENQVLSCGSSSRGAETQTASMWLEGRGIAPANPHAPYSAVAASNRSLVTASQQHHGSSSAAGERDGGSATSETKAVCSQNGCETGRSNPSLSHLLPRSSPSKQADHALEKSAGGSSSQARAAGLIHRANDDFGASRQEKMKFIVIFHFKRQLPDQPADADNFQLLLTEEGGLEEVTERQSPLYL